jgi:hypothetical protein
MISDYIESELARLEGNKTGYACNPAPIQELDKLFQQALAEASQ